MGLQHTHFVALLLYLLVGQSADQVTEEKPHVRPLPARGFGAVELRCGLSTTYDAASSGAGFTIKATIESESRSLEIEGAERNPTTTEYDEWTMHEPVMGGRVEKLVMRHANDWYLAVRSDTGLVRIDRWQLERTSGAYGTDRRVSATAIGTALVTPPLITTIEGVTYVVPKLRSRPTFTKSVVHPGLALERIVGLNIDPDGRFLLALIDLGDNFTELRRISLLDPVGTTETLLDSKTVPMLAQAGGVGLLQHRGLGRAIAIRSGGDSIYLWDRENDGDFERVELMSWYYDVREYPIECWVASY
ncbi:MAG: hypothetical protein JNL28_04180 [Planctomycetes bacterium]|nr:hypothetical protein [Planctomycetota bacterium]